MKILMTLFATLAITSTASAQSRAQIFGDEAELAKLETSVEANCSGNARCIRGVYEYLGTKAIPDLYRDNLNLVAESKRLAGPHAAGIDAIMTNFASSVLKGLMKNLKRDGLTPEIKIEILRRLNSAKRDNTGLREFVDSLKQ